MAQLALTLPLASAYAEETFCVAVCNQQAYDMVMRWPHWPSHGWLLYGEAGAGKTHLAHVWAEKSGATLMEGKALESVLPLSTHHVIESIEQASERALFHALNQAKEGGFSLLLTAASPAAALPFSLPDLTSRLAALPATAITLPDEETLAHAMRKQFSDLQLKVEEDVIRFLLTHMERSFAGAASMVALLNHESLARRKKISEALARECLAAMNDAQ